jgi:type II secretory pathway component GspD/PulD (secretin)
MGKTKVLSNPKLLAVQGQESSIQIGQQLPFITNSTGGPTTTAGSAVVTQTLTSTEWKDVGIILKVTPRRTYDNRVYMDLHIEKSSRGADVTTTEGVNYSVDMNKADVKVLIDNGSTAVIGGLFTETTTGGTDGVPGLSDIPFLGWLFKSKRDGNTRKEMMIFVTPRIIPQ